MNSIFDLLNSLKGIKTHIHYTNAGYIIDPFTGRTKEGYPQYHFNIIRRVMPDLIETEFYQVNESGKILNSYISFYSIHSILQIVIEKDK